MNSKANKTKNQVNNANVLSDQEIQNRIDKTNESMVSYTWRELETNGKFDKNAKLSFIRDDMLILGRNSQGRGSGDYGSAVRLADLYVNDTL